MVPLFIMFLKTHPHCLLIARASFTAVVARLSAPNILDRHASVSVCWCVFMHVCDWLSSGVARKKAVYF